MFPSSFFLVKSLEINIWIFKTQKIFFFFCQKYKTGELKTNLSSIYLGQNKKDSYNT